MYACRNSEEAAMSDPRFTEGSDPNPIPPPTDPTLRDPIERDRTGGAAWGWIAGIAVLILIAFILIGGWGWGGRTGSNTAANAPAPTAAPATTGAAGNMRPPAPTGR